MSAVSPPHPIPASSSTPRTQGVGPWHRGYRVGPWPAGALGGLTRECREFASPKGLPPHLGQHLEQLQGGERRHFYCLRALGVWLMVQQAQDTSCSGLTPAADSKHPWSGHTTPYPVRTPPRDLLGRGVARSGLVGGPSGPDWAPGSREVRTQAWSAWALA